MRSINDGRSKTSLYKSWVAMKRRCDNPDELHKKYYKGIKICNEWYSFDNFRTWALNNGYEEGLTIDRIDVNGNYEPNNCRWVTMKVQCKNRRKVDTTFNKNPKARKIVKLDLLDNYICTYDCIKSAMIDDNINLLSSSISACCKGKAKSAYGYKWKYYKDYMAEKS